MVFGVFIVIPLLISCLKITLILVMCTDVHCAGWVYTAGTTTG